MSEDSYIKLPADEVIALADAKRQRINAWREQAWVKYTDDYNRKWWRRLLRLRPLTIDQVKDDLDLGFNNIHAPRWHCLSEASCCQDLALLAYGAHRGSGEVFLSASDYKTLTT